MPHLVGVAFVELAGPMIGAFMRVLGHPTDRRAGAPLTQRRFNKSSTPVRDRGLDNSAATKPPNIEDNHPPDGELRVKPMYVDAILSALAIALLALFVLIQLIIAALNRISKRRAIFRLPVDVGRAFHSLVADA
jgi:hypothetical protein